jgi:hypothetical protein
MLLAAGLGLGAGRHRVDRGLDDLRHVVGVGDHRDVIRRDLDGGRAHALGKLSLGIGWNRLVTIGDKEPRRQRLPRRRTHHLPKSGACQRLLDREHASRFDWIDVGGEVIDEVLLG